MPFCGRFIHYVPCVPKKQALDLDQNFPEGRWSNFSILSKDSWVQEMTIGNINGRIIAETDSNFGSKDVSPRFFGNHDCKLAYARYMCWINFPRCDVDLESARTCKSSCENVFISCGYEKELWRCGPSRHFNGYEPEAPKVEQNPNSKRACTADSVGTDACLETYHRDFFPGQPFKDGGLCTGAAMPRAKAADSKVAILLAAVGAGAMGFLGG